MTSTIWPGKDRWPTSQKIFFRFFFIYFVLYIAFGIWAWVTIIPDFAGNLLDYYSQSVAWLINTANEKIFHLYKEIVPVNGSGDTSYAFTELLLLLVVSVIATIAWSFADAKRKNYNRLAYWFRILLRYTLIINCFSYGIDKLFCFQMPSPSLSQLATPLGNYLPMRLSWMFMGSSTTYQSFSGAIEVFAGLLLLFRRTATFGTIVALGVFTNVMMMNLGYDIPVKLFSIHLVIMCLVLLTFEYKRLQAFFLNRVTEKGNIYDPAFSKKWMRVTGSLLKLTFIVFAVILPFVQSYGWYTDGKKPSPAGLIKPGVYEVATFVLNKDTIPFNYSDSLRWKDMIFDNNNGGSIGTSDTMFRQRYGRGYFSYNIDSSKQTISFVKRVVTFKVTPYQLGTLHFDFPDSNTIHLYGSLRKDSLNIILVKMNQHFQLADRQFSWLTEYIK